MGTGAVAFRSSESCRGAEHGRKEENTSSDGRRRIPSVELGTTVFLEFRPVEVSSGKKRTEKGDKGADR